MEIRPQRYAGFQAAGMVPATGLFATVPLAHKDGTRTLSESLDGITLHNGFGPIDTALKRWTRYSDQTGSDDR